MTAPSHPPPTAVWKNDGDGVSLTIAGDWLRTGPAVSVTGTPPAQAPSRYQTDALGSHDSTLPAFILAHLRTVKPADGAQEPPPLEGLPDNLRNLLTLALAVPEEGGPHSDEIPVSKIVTIGLYAQNTWKAGMSMLDFVGQTVLSFGRLFRGQARFRRSDFG